MVAHKKTSAQRLGGALTLITALVVALLAVAVLPSRTLAEEATDELGEDSTRGLAAYSLEADTAPELDSAPAAVPSPSEASGVPNASTAASYEGNARGFFAWLGDDYANGYFTSTATSTLDGRTFASYTNMGAADDATNLENMKAALSYIPECNQLRTSDDLFPGRSVLKVSSGAMAVSQVHANWSRNYLNHANKTGDNAPYGENIAWIGGGDPFEQWYDYEKAIYIETQTEDESTGHYLNIVNDTYAGTGYAISEGGKEGFRYTHVQNFSATWGTDRLWDYDEYLSYFNTFYDAHDISTASVSGLTDKNYNGSAQTQDLEVVFNGKVLTADTDYTVRYSNNTRVGEATVTITGAGDYVGSQVLTFRILPTSIASAIPAVVSDQVWTGKEVKPKLAITLGDRTLVEGADYTVVYSNNVDAGTASFTVSGTNGYVDELKGTFTIVPAKVTPEVILAQTSFVYDGNAQKPEVSRVSVTLGGISENVPNSGYTVSYPSDCTNAGAHSVKVELLGNYAGTGTASFTIEKAEQVISARNVSVALGDTVAIAATASGGGRITYQSADASIATVSSSGVVTPVSAGSTTVTIEAGETTNYKAGTLSILVVVSAGNTPEIAASDISVVAGSTVDLRASSTGNGALSYESSDTEIVEVSDSGIVTGVSAGTATVTIISAQTEQYEAASKTVEVTVSRAMPVINVSDTSIVIGDTVDLGVTTDSNGELGYTSSDENIVEILSGSYVVGLSLGTATITVTTEQTGQFESATKNVLVRVTRSPEELSNYEIDEERITPDDIAYPSELDYELIDDGNAIAVNRYRGNRKVVAIPAYIDTLPVTYIGDLCKDNTVIEEVYIPNSVTDFSSETFKGCSSLRAVNLGSISSIDGDSAESFMSGCTALERLTMSDYADLAITANDNDSGVNILTRDCIDNLKYIYIGSGMNDDVSARLFSGKSLEKIDVGEWNILYSSEGGVLYSQDGSELIAMGKSYVGDYTVPDTCSVIKSPGFERCANVGRISVPSTVYMIESPSVFEGCNGTIVAPRGSYVVDYIKENGIDINLEVVDVDNPSDRTSIASATVKVSGQTYTGREIVPKPEVVLDGVTLAEGFDYILSYANNTNAGTASVIAMGIGEYTGSITACFTIARASIAMATVDSIADQSWIGSEVTPMPRVSFGGRTLAKDVDYALSYRSNINVGTATVTITGKGNFTSTKEVTFKIVRSSTPARPTWKRLAGNGRYDTMARIVQEGWKSDKGGVVVLANGYNFKDALAAAGFAGIYDAPIVLTDGGRGNKVTSLSSQARSELVRLAPSVVYVAGGPFAVPEAVVTQVRSLLPQAGIVRVAGDNGCSTSAELAQVGDGSWGDTAIIATDKSFKDALSVAPVSYAKHWPILLAGGGKSLNKDVLAALRTCGIERAYIVGGELAVTPYVVEQLQENDIELAGRLAGKNGIETSRKIAEFALKNGLTVENMAFATSQNFPDALGGAALCGKNNSVLLLCDDKAKGNDANMAFAESNKAGIQTGYVFGGESAFSKGLYDRLPR